MSKGISPNLRQISDTEENSWFFLSFRHGLVPWYRAAERSSWNTFSDRKKKKQTAVPSVVAQNLRFYPLSNMEVEIS